MSSTELDGMKETWKQCRDALEDDELLVRMEEGGMSIVPPQEHGPVSARTNSSSRPRLFSRDANMLIDDDNFLADKEKNLTSTVAEEPASNNNNQTTPSASPTPARKFEATPSRTFKPTPSRTTYTHVRNNNNSEAKKRQRPMGTSSRKVSSSELPSLKDLWKLSRRSLELEDQEIEAASNWVGAKPQVLFQEVKKRGSIEEVSSG